MRGISIKTTLLFLFSICGILNLEGQSLDSLQKKLDQVILHIYASEINQADSLVSSIISDLEETNQLESTFGLKVLGKKVTTLLHIKEYKEATALALQVIEDAEAKELWAIAIDTRIYLALLYELTKLPALCKDQLDQAHRQIRQYDQYSQYPHLCNRMASYFRIIARDLDPAYHYAMEGSKYLGQGTILDQAENNLLLGMVHAGGSFKDDSKAIQYYHKARDAYQKCGDDIGMVYGVGNLSKLHFRKGEFEKALLYNDTAMLYIKAHERKVGTVNSIYRGILNVRANLFKELGQLDSALYYKDQYIQFNYRRENERKIEAVREIEARYQGEKRLAQIEQQRQEIKFERQRTGFFAGLVTLFLIITGLSIYFNIRLRKVNQETKLQAAEITQKNEELSVSLEKQIMLQGEVHHRVKNNLQIIISLLELQMDELSDPEAKQGLTAMANRIHSMAAIHQFLYQNEGQELVELEEYIQDLCEHFSILSLPEKRPIFNLQFAEQAFNLNTLIPLGLIITELLTNSLKYATSPEQRLTVEMELKQVGTEYLLTYRDNGPGFPDHILQEKQGGMGTYLIKSMSRQLGGRLERSNEKGAVTKVYFKEKIGFSSYQTIS